MYAVIRTGGKQYTVEQGTELDVELLDGAAGDKISLNDVLLVGSESGVKVGQPIVAGASVDAQIVAQKRGEKVITFKKIRRHGKQRKVGHRQDLTRIKVTNISG